jgi:hypothetical protein
VPAARRTPVPKKPKYMRLTITIPSATGEFVKNLAAARDQGNVSAWFLRAADKEIRREQMRAVLADYEGEHGKITDGEMQAARARWQLG